MVDPLRFAAIKQARQDIQAAEAELATLRQSISDFEALVNRRLGELLDQLSALEAEVDALTLQVRTIRDQRLYGEHQMGYVEGAPRPELRTDRVYVPNQDVFTEPPVAASAREYSGRSSPASSQSAQSAAMRSSPLDPKAEFKRLYRRLARLYHPDLSVSGADHAQRTRQMAIINQAYAAGDLPLLQRLWDDEGIEPPRFDLVQPAPQVGKSELELLQERLRLLRQQITRLGNHPNLQLSLEVKLARQRGHDLLGEMAKELRRKIARKSAERDYLQSQIAANP